MSRKGKNFVDDFGEALGVLLKEMNNKSTSQRALASLAGIDKDMVTRIFNGEIKSFRVLVALMAVIFESRGARQDDKEGQKRDDIHRFFVALEQNFRKCLDAYEQTPDFTPGTHYGQITDGTHSPIDWKPKDKNALKQSRLVVLLENEIKLFLEKEQFGKEKKQGYGIRYTIPENHLRQF